MLKLTQFAVGVELGNVVAYNCIASQQKMFSLEEVKILFI